MTFEQEWREDQERIRQLALLCLEQRDLTDEELAEIEKHGQEVSSYLIGRAQFAGSGVNRMIRARHRRKELDKLPTEELQAQMNQINEDHSRTLAADVWDEADDSLYEAPPFDSDAHIISELLKERTGPSEEAKLVNVVE